MSGSITSNEVRGKYQKYFEEKGHVRLPSGPLIPENDPTTLFTGSGMQPFIPYLLGQEHPQGNRLVNAQKCFRAEDIEEVGDNRHTTFFEMLGNWSLGDYFKQEQIRWIYAWLVDEMGCDPQNIYISVLGGIDASGIPRDQESIDIWQDVLSKYGVEPRVVDYQAEKKEARAMQDGRIFIYDADKNWWSRSGVPENMPAGEPGGPDSEMFYDFGLPHNDQYGSECHPNCDCGRFIEIGNSVFMEYKKSEDGSFVSLPKKNVDFGGGLERIAAAVRNEPDVYLINSLNDCIKAIEDKTGQVYGKTEGDKSFRIVADHLRGAVFMLAEGLEPSNVDQGYYVRRLLRRAIRQLDMLGGKEGTAGLLVGSITGSYAGHYGYLAEVEGKLKKFIDAEEEKFRRTLKSGLKEFEKWAKGSIEGADAWNLFATYGFPIEMTKDLAVQSQVKLAENFDIDFEKQRVQHQALSRKGADRKFKGGLADKSKMVIKYHTATHLLHAALREVLGEHVQQKGSNITDERLRFDFTHGEKLSEDELMRIEELVNEQVSRDQTVTKKEVTLEEARNMKALGFFEEKYGERVSVYSIGDFSREICGGPHLPRTGGMGLFKITKEESVAAGVRRIKAILE